MSVHGVHSNHPLQWDSQQVQKPKQEPESHRVTSLGNSPEGKRQGRSNDDREKEHPDGSDADPNDNHGPDTGTIINVTG